ncbi:uncharacterized protein LOC111067102 [Drosophila obscura]|uniref:uncharacterized protein LOC111067102 n=1 Tax=Drosophila obscura TaxID=7282 RepID=UPI001BB24FF1|nr:uncharacterized protein LOC111067102 [Drosophila obscura]
MEPATAGAGRRPFARRRREQQQSQPQQQQQQRRTRLSPVWNSNWNSDKRSPARGSSNIAVVRPSRSSIQAQKTRPASTCVHPGGCNTFSNPYLSLLYGKEQADAGVGTNRNRTTAYGRTCTMPAPPTASQVAKGRPRTRTGLVRKTAKSKECRPHQCSSLDHMVPCAKKALAESHQQLEMLLTGIERESYRVAALRPPPRRRRSGGARGRGGSNISKGVRRQTGRPPPPAPAGSPMLSARCKENAPEDAEHIRHLVPLACNPQLLPPAKREALLELISRAEQHDNGIVELLRPPMGSSSRDTRLTMLQMLPLSLDECPYVENIWTGRQDYLYAAGCGQQLPEKLRTEDERFKEAKILRSRTGQVLLSRTLEEELKDEKMVLHFMEEERKRRQQQEAAAASQPLNERQQQAMRERAELEQHKQLVSQCRERRRQLDLKRELTETRKSQRKGKIHPRRMLAKVVPESEDDEQDVAPWSNLRRSNKPPHIVHRSVAKADDDPDLDALNELLERRPDAATDYQLHAHDIVQPEIEDQWRDAASSSCSRGSNQPSEIFERSLAQAHEEPDALRELLERRCQFQVHSQAMIFPNSEDEEQDTAPSAMLQGSNQHSDNFQRSVAQANDDDPAADLNELLDQRDLFQLHSQACCLYQTVRSSTPWDICAEVAMTCSLELVDGLLDCALNGSETSDKELSV